MDHINEENRVYRKVILRIAPLLFICYIVAYLDRVNIGFAKLQMLGDLGMSDAAFAFGAAIFFWGYVIFEAPSNMLLHKYGARFWISRIMVVWGIVSASIAFTGELAIFFGVSTETMFYILRFLLGVSEAGFFPGVILYLTYWFPAHRQSKILARFLLALPVSLVIGGPLSGWLLNAMHGFHNYSGWQWMLILEGIPALILGVVVFAILPSKIEHAKWLTAAEKVLLRTNVEREISENKKTSNLKAALLDWRVWLLALIMLCFNTGFYGLSFWLPSIIKASGVDDTLIIGVITAMPFFFASLAMLFNGYHSNKTGERRLHAFIPAMLGGLGLMLSTLLADNLYLSIFFLCIGASGLMSLMPIFWTFPGSILSGRAAAAGIAVITSVGSFSGFTGSMITGLVKEITGNINHGTYVLALALFLCGFLILLIPRNLLQKQ